MPIYITNKTYIYIYSHYKSDKFWASETFSFWRYQPCSLINLKEAVEQPYYLAKNMIFILTSCVYFGKKFSEIIPVYLNVILKS